MKLTVNDMLKMNQFKNVQIISGNDSLNKEVSWTHIIEIEDFGHLLNGNEVIFTTGMIWKNDDEIAKKFIKQLIEHNTTALCVELVVYAQKIPDSMLEIARENNFPIIVFHEEVRFIDISMEIHEKILGSKERIWEQLDNFYQKLLNVFIHDGKVGDFLKILHQETNKHILLEYKNEFLFFPTQKEAKKTEILAQIDSDEYFSYPIYLMNKKVGSLYYLHPFHDINDFQELAIKRFADVINKYFLRNEEQKEKEALLINNWLLDILKKPYSNEDISTIFHNKIPYFEQAIIGIKPIITDSFNTSEQTVQETKLIMNLRSIVESEQLSLTVTTDIENQTTILLVHAPFFIDIEKKLAEIINKLDSVKEIQSWKQSHLLSFGIPFQEVSNIKTSYEAALIALDYQKNIQTLESPFYNQLHFYRILHHFHHTKELQNIIEYYIYPLIKYDQEKNTELVKTLTVYLDEFGQKNETANRLHIVRQTLYHRLHKIEELIGKDYLEGEKRFMIEFALKVIQYIN